MASLDDAAYRRALDLAGFSLAAERHFVIGGSGLIVAAVVRRRRSDNALMVQRALAISLAGRGCRHTPWSLDWLGL